MDFQLNLNEAISIKNNYNNNVVIKRKKEGYFIETEKEIWGPFALISAENFKEYNNDLFLFASNYQEINVFRNGIYGLEKFDSIDTTNQLISELKKHKVNLNPTTNTYISDCDFIESLNVTQISCLPFDEYRAKTQSRFIYKNIPNQTLMLYKTKEGQLFIIDPSKPIKPLKSYRKFDSFDELWLSVSAKNPKIRLISNRRTSLSTFVNKLSTIVSNFIEEDFPPYEYILSILKELKKHVDLDDYKKGIIPKIKISTMQNCYVKFDELINALNNQDFSILSQYCNNPHHITTTGTDNSMSSIARKEINAIAKTLKSYQTITTSSLSISNSQSAEDIVLTFEYPNDEELRNIKTDDSYLNLNVNEAPDKWATLYLIQKSRLKKYVQYLNNNQSNKKTDNQPKQ